MTVMKAVCKTPPRKTGKKIAPGEKIIEADKTVKTTQGTEDSGGVCGTTMVNRIIAHARSKKEAEDAIVAKVSKQKDATSKALASKEKNTGSILMKTRPLI
jgi:hypothetical protein